MRKPNSYELDTQKFSFYYINEEDSYWHLTNNLQINGSIHLLTNDPITSEINKGQLIYKDDKKMHFINENAFDSILDNELYSQFDISMWNITNDDKVHTYSSVVIADSDISDTYKLRVKGNVQITGRVDASAGDLTANNADLSGSLSVNGFKSTNLNTQNLTVEDRNYQVGFIDVTLIDNLDESTYEIKSRIPHKLSSNDYVYFQETSIYFEDSSSNLRTINGYKKILVTEANALKIYDPTTELTNTKLVYKTFNPPRYIGLNNVSDSVIDNTNTIFTQTDAIRVRIFMISSTEFKYSLNGGFNYETTTFTLNSDLTTSYSLLSGTTSIGIVIKFTTISGFVTGDYWEFDCCPPYILERDEDGAIIPPTEENFLGEFGKILGKNELLDSGFEVMMRNPNSYTLETQKFSFFYTNENDAYWKLTANLHVLGSLQMQVKDEPASQIADQGQLIYRNDKKAHFINEDGFDSVLDNDLSSQFDISMWNITNDDKVHTYSSVVIADSDISDTYKLRVKGNVQITGRVDAAAGDLTANNADLSGSLSVNGFKSTNLNTQNLTVEDRNYQVGFIDVTLIDNLESNEIKSRIPHKLSTNDYVYFQETSVYFQDSGSSLRSINGYKKITVIEANSLKIYDPTTGNTNTTLVYKTFNPPRYIGLNNISDSVIDNTSTSFNQTDAVRVRILMTSSTVFKYSLNGGFNYESTTYTLNSDLTTSYSLLSGTTDFGINIKFTTITGFVTGDYWEFDCCPPYILERDEDGAIIPPTEENFLGEFGKILPKNELLDAGFEIMMRNPNSYTLETQKFSYFYTNENDAYWKLTSNLHVLGSLQMEVKDEPTSQIVDQGQLIYRNDKKVHFINEDGFDSILDNDLSSQFDISLWNITNDNKVHTYSSVVIADSDISDTYKLRVKGNVQITGRVDAAAGDLTANNADLSGSLSVNGFKSTNLNTQNLTVEDRNYQVGFIDVTLIDNLDSNEIRSRIPHKLSTNDYVYFQETVYTFKIQVQV